MDVCEVSKALSGMKKRKRKGRGPASGNGKTSGRGQKGQKSRSGGYHKVGFEGGQMPLQRRLPKRGFKNPFRKVYQIVKVSELLDLDVDGTIDKAFLAEKGILKNALGLAKLLKDVEVNKKISIKIDKASKSAVSDIEKQGGKVVFIGDE